MNKEFSTSLSANMNYFNQRMAVNKSFDVVYRVIHIGGKEACIYFKHIQAQHFLLQNNSY